MNGNLIVVFFVGIAAGCSGNIQMQENQKSEQLEEKIMSKDKKLATFGGGCFWCTEAFFQELKGVNSVVSGYSGGEGTAISYKSVSTRQTGHAEVIQVSYDPTLIAYKELLEVFWKTHDPTTLNRQGADKGTQYRSVIFYHDDKQRELATAYKKKLDESGAYNSPIVTEISEFKQFIPAEDYHQNYYRENSKQGYCIAVIQPKLDKFRKVFAEKLATPQPNEHND